MGKIFAFIAHLFDILKLDILKFLDKIAVPAVQLVNVLRLFANSPEATAIAALGEIPAEIITAFRNVLPAIAQYLNYIRPVEVCLATGTDAEVLKCLSGVLQTIDPNLLPEVYRKVAALIAAELAKLGIHGQAPTPSQLNFLIELALQKVSVKPVTA